ncbi:hypothetical protein V6N13_068528 [Hibiscus sabdariffa]
MVDLNKPLVPCIGIDGFVQRLEYEGLQNICYNCGVYGHGREACPQLSKSAPPVNETVSIPTATGPALEACSIKSSKELFGPWMIVDNRCRRIPPNKPSGGRQDLVMKDPLGSCFAVLNSSDTVEDTITGEVEVSPQASDELAPIGTDVQVASGPGVVRTVTVGIELPKRKPRSSPASSSQIETIPMLPENLLWTVANGHSVNFWHDCWLHGIGPLASHVGVAQRSLLPSIPVASMVDNSGEWRWSDFQHLLPVQVLLRLAATKAPSPLFPADEIGWGLRSNRQFSIKFAYDVRLGFAGGVAERIWRTIHDFRGLPKIKFFMWLACKVLFCLHFFLCRSINGLFLILLALSREAVIVPRGIYYLPLSYGIFGVTVTLRFLDVRMRLGDRLLVGCN